MARRLHDVERFVVDSLAQPEAAADTGAGPPVHLHLVEGGHVEAVARLAREEGADLVLAGRPDDSATSVDALLDAAGEAAQCPTVRVPICSPSPPC